MQVYYGQPTQNEAVAKERFHVGTRLLPSGNVKMSPQSSSKSAPEQTKKAAFRNTTLSLKLTEAEADLLEQAAAARGIARSEWMREVILRELRPDPNNNLVLAEIVGVRLLLVNVLRSLAAGEEVGFAKFDGLLNEISTVKHELAAKIVDRYKQQVGSKVKQG